MFAKSGHTWHGIASITLACDILLDCRASPIHRRCCPVQPTSTGLCFETISLSSFSFLFHVRMARQPESKSVAVFLVVLLSFFYLLALFAKRCRPPRHSQGCGLLVSKMHQLYSTGTIALSSATARPTKETVAMSGCANWTPQTLELCDGPASCSISFWVRYIGLTRRTGRGAHNRVQVHMKSSFCALAPPSSLVAPHYLLVMILERCPPVMEFGKTRTHCWGNIADVIMFPKC